MTTNKHFKALVREAALPGESYAATRARVLRSGGPPLQPDEATQVMRDALTRAFLLDDMPDYEELSWSGGPPLFPGYEQLLRRDLKSELPPAFATMWARACELACAAQLEACSKQLLKLAPMLKACGWDDFIWVPEEFEEDAAAVELALTAGAPIEAEPMVESRRDPTTGAFRAVTFHLGGKYRVTGGPHRGRLCTLLAMGDEMATDRAWVLFDEEEKAGAVDRRWLEERMTDAERTNPLRCQTCSAMRESVPTLALTGARLATLRAAVEALLDQLLQLYHAEPTSHPEELSKLIATTFQSCVRPLTELGRALGRRGRDLYAEVDVDAPVRLEPAQACLICDGVHESPGGWFEGREVTAIADDLAQIATMLVTAERLRGEGDPTAVRNMAGQALRQVRFSFDDVGLIPTSAERGAYREFLDAEGLRWPAPEKSRKDDLSEE